MNRHIMTFESVHHALRAEKTIRSAGLDAHVINTPRRLSNDCGISLVFSEGEKARVLNTMTENQAIYKALYEYEEEL